MNMAKIEIYSRNVDGIAKVPNKGIPQHLFILITYTDGSQYIIRGGPKDEENISDVLVVVGKSYTAKNQHFFPNDFFSDADLGKLPKYTVATGTDTEVLSFAQGMKERIMQINDEYYTYKLSLCSGSWCANQNSNTIVKDIIKYVGLTPEIPKYSDGQKVWAPGWHNKLKDLPFDEFLYGFFGYSSGASKAFSSYIGDEEIELFSYSDIDSTEIFNQEIIDEL